MKPVMGRNLLLIISGILGLALLGGCTDKQEFQIHPDGWTEIGSDYSHMKKISASGISVCKKCHGGTDATDYFGGTSGVSCYQCHESGPSGHAVWNEWMNSSSENFHGETAESRGISTCQECHGSNLLGGAVELGCNTCHSPDDIEEFLTD